MSTFLVDVLRQRPDTQPTQAAKDFLTKNCTFVARRNLWLFEGEYWVFERDELVAFECVAEVAVPALHGLDDDALAALVEGVA